MRLLLRLSLFPFLVLYIELVPRYMGLHLVFSEELLEKSCVGCLICFEYEIENVEQVTDPYACRL
jgi:hypothetical protein